MFEFGKKGFHKETWPFGRKHMNLKRNKRDIGEGDAGSQVFRPKTTDLTVFSARICNLKRVWVLKHQ